jgi:hypothetical protein
VSPSGLGFLLAWFPVVYTTGSQMPPSGLKTGLHRGVTINCHPLIAFV